MIKHASRIRHLGLKLALVALLALPELASAQFFQYNKFADVLAGFRKTGTADTTGFEMVADLGNVTNYLLLPSGTTITITNFTAGQLTDAFGNNNNLQWSAFATFQPGGLTFKWSTPLGLYPNDTMWLTLPGTNVSTQTQPPSRASTVSQANQVNPMLGVGGGAIAISEAFSESVDNTNSVVREPEAQAYAADDLAAEIGDVNTPSLGDFGSGGSPLPYTVENTTPASFSASQRSDFYQLVPSDKVDPITGTQSTNSYFVGYFLLNSNGSMTFTRASAVSAPTAGPITASATNGFGPLTVTFTNTASGSITNWVWNFGNGTSVTNATGANVTFTYPAAGSYTVTLTVSGPGGSSTTTVANFVVASPKPKINFATVNGKLVFTGTNCPIGIQYRILTATNATTLLPNWKPVYTNTFDSNGNFAYTNTPGPTNLFFIMASP